MSGFFGRKNDLGKIWQIYEQVQKGGSRAVLISGQAGSGKTALVNRFGVEAEKAGALFFHGKGDTLFHNTPFATVTRAMNLLVKKAIAENPDGRERLKSKIRQNLGLDLGPLLNLVPALCYLFEDVPVPGIRHDIPDDTSTNLRLLSLLESFVFPRRPLLLFLDDFQWMDAASHGFLRYLVTNGLPQGILLVMAFRNEASEKTEILNETAALYQKQETSLCLSLSGLTKRDTRGLLKTRLEAGHDLTPLADICHKKTAGNPFYLTQMLDELLEKGVISRNNGEWRYDIAYISGMGFTDNVADLIIKRIKTLEPDSLNLLKQAACIHSDITVPLLEATSGLDQHKIDALLWKPVQQGFLHNTQDGLAFAHDRILESIEVLLSDDEAFEIHQRLVTFFLADERRADLEKNIFKVCYHYAFYSHTIADPTVQKEMAGIYFQAGEQARSQSAYALALAYFQKGKDCFPGDIWTDDHALAIRFCRQLAECAYLAGDFNTADRIFEEAESRTTSFSDRLAIEMVKIPSYQAQEKEEMALDAGLTILGHLGVRIPKDPSDLTVLWAILKTWTRFIFNRKETVKQKRMAPGMDAYKAVQSLNALGGIAYASSSKKLLPLVTTAALNLSLKHGNMEESPVGYIVFGHILNVMTDTVKWGRRLSKLAREISLNIQDDRYKTKEMTQINLFIDPWDKPLKENIRIMERTERFCLRMEDHQYYSYNVLYGMHRTIIGYTPLNKVRQKIDEKKRVIERLNNRFVMSMLNFMEQAIDNLEKGGSTPWIIRGDYFDETNPDTQTVSFSEEIFYLYRFFIAFYSGRLDIAGDIHQTITDSVELQKGATLTIYFLFLSALTDINLNRAPKRIKGHLKRLKKYASYNGAIYDSKYRLARGDSLRMKGNPKAVEVYEDAMSAAKENGFLFEQALACEGLGKVFKERGDEKRAEAHFSESIRLCRKWGLKWRHGLFDPGVEERPISKETFSGQQNRAVIPVESRATTGPLTGVPAIEGMIDDLLRTLKALSGATAIHAAHQRAQFWKSIVYIDEGGIHRPATFVPLPEKMISFASTTGEVIQADVDSIEEELLDTDYFWRRRPSSVMVIPGKERNAVYIENFETIPDKETLIRQAEQILAQLGPNPAAASPAEGANPADEQQLRDQCRILQAYMINQQAFRNPSLSLAGLAKEVKMPQRTITDALNSSLGQNFKYFVNSYRIEAVKQALADPALSHKTILDIAFALGFNSKSTFNGVFKNIMGMTPSNYRDTLMRKEMN